jgi:sugar/nucleoside kinase (ribokinase family)
VREAIHIAKENGTKIALTCSEAFIVEVFGDAFRSALAQTDLLFCNAAESKAVTGASDAASAFEQLRSLVPAAIVTDGANGVFVRFGSAEGLVPAFPCEPKDLTGAGDMLAGAFLYGVTHEIAPLSAARAANFLAMKVITQVGARLHRGTRQYWEEVLASG